MDKDWNPDIAMLLQILDSTAIFEQAAKTQPGDNSGYVFAVSLLTFLLVASLGAVAYLHKMVNTLQKDMVTKVESMASRNTELLMSIEGFFERITTDLGHVSPQIVREAEACSARIKEHMNKVGEKIQKNEPINTDTQYNR